MRAALGSGFEWNIPYMLIKTAADIQLWHEYPCMLKPADSQGQRGVFRLDSLTDFYRYYDTSLKFSRRKELIVEKFIDGPEISVNAYVKDHQFIFMQTTDRISFPGYPSGIIKKHQIPSVRTTPALERYIRDLMEQVIQTLDIANGPVYFQLKLSNNVPMLIEVTPRLDGCHLWRLIKYHTGVDLLAITFHHLIANKVPFQLLVANHPRPYRLEFFSEKPGAAVNRNQYTYPPALFLEWYYPAGETVQPINGYMEKIGYYIAEDN